MDGAIPHHGSEFSTVLYSSVATADRSMASHPLRYAILLITTWCRVRGAMLLQAALQGNEIGYTSFDVHGKNAPVQFSTDPKISVFLLNVQKAAAGLTLTAATHVFLVEPLLNPGRSRATTRHTHSAPQCACLAHSSASTRLLQGLVTLHVGSLCCVFARSGIIEMQAIGRVHRIGQTKPTFVHKYLVEDTVEVRVHEVFERTKAAITGDAGASSGSSGAAAAAGGGGGARGKTTEKMSAEDAQFLLGKD